MKTTDTHIIDLFHILCNKIRNRGVLSFDISKILLNKLYKIIKAYIYPEIPHEQSGTMPARDTHMIYRTYDKLQNIWKQENAANSHTYGLSFIKNEIERPWEHHERDENVEPLLCGWHHPPQKHGIGNRIINLKGNRINQIDDN